MSSYDGATQKVIEPEEVEQYTRSGWRVMRMFQTSVPVDYVVKAMEQGSPENNWQMRSAVVQQQVGLVTKFVVSRVRDEEMEALRQAALVEAESAEAVAHQLERAEALACAAQTAELRATEALKQANDRAAEAHTRADAREAAVTEKLRLAEARARKAEADIAKIRGAIGELQMKEIMGS